MMKTKKRVKRRKKVMVSCKEFRKKIEVYEILMAAPS